MLTQIELFENKEIIPVCDYGLKNLTAAILRKTVEDARVVRNKHTGRTPDCVPVHEVRVSVREFVQSTWALELCLFANIDYNKLIEMCQI